jgi:hypothetical protein
MCREMVRYMAGTPNDLHYERRLVITRSEQPAWPHYAERPMALYKARTEHIVA